VTELDSEEQFDAALAQHAQRLIVLEASLTWCRPCKGFERTYQVRAAVDSLSALLGSNPAHVRGPEKVPSKHVRLDIVPALQGPPSKRTRRMWHERGFVRIVCQHPTGSGASRHIAL